MTIIVKALFYLIRLLPVRLAGALGAGLGRVAYYLDARHRQIAMRNLSRVYPDKSTVWKRNISRESFAELGRTTFEIPHVFLRSKAFLLSRIELDGEQEALKAIESGQGAIFTGCHYSNWELSAMTLSMLGQPCSMLHRPLRQASMEHMLKTWRQRFGNLLHARDESIRWIPKALKNGKHLALLIDQHLSNGIAIPFLGHPAYSTTMPAVYARKYNTPIFTGIMHRKGRGFHFRAEFRQIKFPEKTADANQDLLDYSAIISGSYAAAIHSRPELWLWIHRRWLYLDIQEDADT